MARGSKEKSFLEIGKDKEAEFAAFFQETEFSSKDQDIREHWDISIKYKVDVKGMKKILRTDTEPNQNWHYLEIKNVKGNKGWVYGDADYFAFELEKYWILVEKKNLQFWISQNIEKEYTDSPEAYKLYTRTQREDIITLIPSIDLCFLATKMIKKTLKGKNVTL